MLYELLMLFLLLLILRGGQAFVFFDDFVKLLRFIVHDLQSDAVANKTGCIYLLSLLTFLLSRLL